MCAMQARDEVSEVRLLEQKRSDNITIMLSKFKGLPLTQIKVW